MEFHMLHPDLGVEVIGFDVLAGRDPGDIAKLKAAYDEHQFLLFRGSEAISHERHAEIAAWFGPVQSKDGDMIQTLDNVNGPGRGRLPFHSDNSYTDHPAHGISLHALALPEEGTRTIYVSGIAAWSRLPNAMQERLAGMTLQHRYVTKYTARVLEFTARHPLCRPHAATGRPILYIDESHADHICELDKEESARLIGELLQALYQPENIFCHNWQLHDLVIWDNFALQHSRPDEAKLADGARVLQRVTLGDVSYHSIVDSKLTELAERESATSAEEE